MKALLARLVAGVVLEAEAADLLARDAAAPLAAGGADGSVSEGVAAAAQLRGIVVEEMALTALAPLLATHLSAAGGAAPSEAAAGPLRQHNWEVVVVEFTASLNARIARNEARRAARGLEPRSRAEMARNGEDCAPGGVMGALGGGAGTGEAMRVVTLDTTDISRAEVVARLLAIMHDAAPCV